MKRVIDDLWYSHLIEMQLQRSEKEEQLIKAVTETDNKLRETLTKEQNSLLEEYDRAVCLLGCNTEKQAFAKGVKFTVRFLFEALCED